MKYEKTLQCLLCEASAELKYEDYPGYQKPDTFGIYFCPACDTSFSWPRISTNGIYELIYKYGPRVRWYDVYWKNSEMVKIADNPLEYLAESEASYWGVKRSLDKITKAGLNSPKVLEIGCGLGYLTYSLNKAGYNAFGLDISSEAVAKAIENYGDFFICADLHDYARTHMQEYDIIIFTEVVEHLDNIKSFMSSMITLLNSNGKIILTTPNKSFYPSKVLWATDLPPVHYWWLSENSIACIAKQLKLSVNFLNFSPFYRKHPMGFDVRKISIPITPPVFEKDGSLIGKSAMKFTRKQENYIKRYAKDLLLFAYAKIKYTILGRNPNYLIPAKRGLTICAVLQKSN